MGSANLYNLDGPLRALQTSQPGSNKYLYMYIYGTSIRTFNSTLLGYKVTGEADNSQEKHIPQVFKGGETEKTFFFPF